MLRLLHGRTDLHAVTLVLPQASVPRGQLAGLKVRPMLEKVKRQLERAALPQLVVIGSLDLSLGSDRSGQLPTLWQPHLHMITAGCRRTALRTALGPHYHRTKRVPRPLHIDQVQDSDRPVQFSYTCKAVYQRRVGYADDAGKPKTMKFVLRDEELREVLRFVDGHSFGELMIMKGVRRIGSRLRLLSG
jgi:hypothetical protein